MKNAPVFHVNVDDFSFEPYVLMWTPAMLAISMNDKIFAMED